MEYVAKRTTAERRNDCRNRREEEIALDKALNRGVLWQGVHQMQSEEFEDPQERLDALTSREYEEVQIFQQGDDRIRQIMMGHMGERKKEKRKPLSTEQKSRKRKRYKANRLARSNK